MNDGLDCPDCDAARARLEAYVDRELTDADRTQIKRHLADCPDCQRCFGFEEGVKTLVRRKGCPELAPPELVSRILEHLRG
ncbi:MAG TPA: mycothiol system anti-sigma-R factor [Candidatus Dormibacteraeota bacterium]|jgi:mycothiol system anti-sigma-R factor|nr:mycothiol system anti-sigma-R factor [Candidatus Dormibacteraeota bacterium]